MIIRAYETKDREHVESLIIRGLLDFATTDEHRKIALEEKEHLQKKLNQLDRCALSGWPIFNVRYWIVESGGLVVGGIGLEPTPRQPSDAKEMVSIHGFTVEKNYRRHGIGKLLINHAEKYAISQEITRIRLGTQKNLEAAVSFYQHCGYKEDKRVRQNPKWKGVKWMKFEKVLKK